MRGGDDRKCLITKPPSLMGVEIAMRGAGTGDRQTDHRIPYLQLSAKNFINRPRHVGALLHELG